ncbi:MAG: hypothetical protein KKA81_17520, partial [Bacteroidetes bacterium]|nr:hypothetical protein [Bacteroidota bacterium]
IDENKIEKEKTSLYSQLYKKFRKVIYAGTTAVLLGVLGYCGVSGTYESLSQRPQIQPQVRTAQIQEQAKPLEKIVVGKEGKSKVFFYEGTDVKIPGTVEYKIQKGDRLWSLAEALGISQANIPRFVNELVEKQTDYENSESFLEKISKDTIYVSNGKILHGSDGIKGDSLDVGDSFYIDESLINKYGGDFEKVKELGNLIVKEEPKQKQTQKVKQVSEKKQPKQEQKESKETVGLYMPNQEKPFGVFQRDFANDAEKYYENLSGQDIEQKACSYSTHLSIELPAAETQRVTENYIKARLGKNMNMDVMEAYSLLDNLKVEEKRQFVKDFELDYEKATNNIYDMYKQGKNMEQIVNDAEYSWVDEELVRHVVAY